MITITSSSTSNDDVPVVLHVAGRLDSQASIELIGAVQKLITAEKHEIIMDFQKLEAVSSEGLAALIQSKSKLQKMNGALRLANIHGPILEVFELVHFDRLFDVHSNIEEGFRQLAIERQSSNQPDDARSDN